MLLLEAEAAKRRLAACSETTSACDVAGSPALLHLVSSCLDQLSHRMGPAPSEPHDCCPECAARCLGVRLPQLLQFSCSPRRNHPLCPRGLPCPFCPTPLIRRGAGRLEQGGHSGVRRVLAQVRCVPHSRGEAGATVGSACMQHSAVCLFNMLLHIFPPSPMRSQTFLNHPDQREATFAAGACLNRWVQR